ncbi:hypothetical protein H6F41_18645 [Pseudanabaena sp. FACHB-723]|uniref:Uncharacterized protein n=1 Tax=Pseudanabaena mucicola FACHB-723 TaxID=2692860 RepID=A0ABR8A1P6_9CYAN|nr:hypothetical protein [Pseudanabaena mucicola FACHB-723]
MSFRFNPIERSNKCDTLPQRGEGEQNPENSYSPRPLGEGLGVRVLETST